MSLAVFLYLIRVGGLHFIFLEQALMGIKNDLRKKKKNLCKKKTPWKNPILLENI